MIRSNTYLWFLGRRNTVEHCQPPACKILYPFRCQPYDDGHPGSVQDREDDICPPANVADGGGSNVNDDEIANPIRGSRY